ncbi:hypothetical protein PIROE2DRAFT_2612 [Piromyces sp. E2]|nr:hypothetical protein PIROE2DRAFT_2612 [Piromyces sp. E2]|eukprot:OUM69515.1 hypothetical protein PIROE2DRAFT_2612 [Piromyces sp. E2]
MESIENYEISETNRGKKQIIIDRKYKFNFSYKKVNNSKIYRCTNYKTDYKCKSFIILNDKNKIIKYYNNHNHLEEDYDATMSLLKHEINKSIKDETSLGKYCPSYNSVRTQMMRMINKQYPNIKTKDIFVDGTFSTAPKFSYQLFITRNCIKEYKCFYTTYISILKIKKQANYEILLKEVNKNACKHKNNVIISPIKFHCDISNAAKKIFS